MTPDELAARFEHAAMKIGPAIQKGVEHTAELGAARIRGYASGRPGPNVISGDYRDSWQPAPIRRFPYGASCTIGTELPYGRRLEFGFTGTDSLGRYYDQKPLPHVQPALPYIEQTLMGQMRLAVSEVLL
ncbi:HK97 gp10 family phage protein [Streptomyces sp. NPDC090499]|uniref:HK97 gp10 family phage protein n=1 Tax=Streptomyces sp. NPDC090499 TaxID=3365965 RepID=UPI003820C504